MHFSQGHGKAKALFFKANARQCIWKIGQDKARQGSKVPQGSLKA